MTEEIKAVVEKFGKCPRCSSKGFYMEEPRNPELIDICMVCSGHGKIRINSNMMVCGKCNGKGKIVVQQQTPFGMQKVFTACDRCKGTSIVLKDVKSE